MPIFGESTSIIGERDRVNVMGGVLVEYRGTSGVVLQQRGRESLVRLDQKPNVEVWFFNANLISCGPAPAPSAAEVITDVLDCPDCRTCKAHLRAMRDVPSDTSSEVPK